MPRKKQDNRKEILRKKRIDEKKRRERIKCNPELYKEYLQKEKTRYAQRKEEKKLLAINELTPRLRRIQRKKWKTNQKNVRARKLQIKKMIHKDTLPASEPEDDLEIIEGQPAQREQVSVSSDRTEHDHSPKRRKPPSASPSAPISNPLNETPAPSHDRFPKRLSSSTKRNPSDKLPGPSCSPSHLPSPKRSSTNAKSNLSESRKFRYELVKNESRYKKNLLDIRQQNKSLLRRISRLKQTIKKIKSTTGPRSPRTEAEILIADPAKIEEVKKALVFKDIVTNNMNIDYEKQTKCEKRKLKENIDPIRNKLKKYNLLQELPKITRKTNSKEQDDTKRAETDSDLKAFYEDDNNSRITSGKKECITLDKQKEQKRFLNDTLTNLHKKFLREHNYGVSYSYFCKARPFWVIAPTEKDRETCKCKLHENVDLLAKALSINKIIVEKSSKDIISASVCDIHSLKCIERKCRVCINRGPTVMDFDNTVELNYYMWESGYKEISTQNGTRRIRITEKKQHIGKPKYVLELLLDLLKKLYVHTANIINQYDCTTKLKKAPEDNSAVIHMDFSENYSTKYNTEIQSMHFGGSRTNISLHTSVIYISGRPKPTSFCTYSDCVRHDAIAVWAHIIPLLDFIEKTAPETDSIHFMTDSTCSQYRNKTMNYILTKLHWYLPKLKTVTWNYSEAGHGKGAPDGVGGTLKRTADQIIRQGKDIPDIDTFAKEMKKSVKNVILEYVPEYNIIEKEYLMPARLLKPFKGIMQAHQIVWDSNNKNKIALRRQSCIVDMCKNYATACPHGKHLGFYSYSSEEPSKSGTVVINSNVLLQPRLELQSHVDSQNEFQTHLPHTPENNDESPPCSSLGVQLQRPENIARKYVESPTDDMEIPTNRSQTPEHFDDNDDTFRWCSSSNVAMIQRSKAPVARTEAELPIQLQISPEAELPIQLQISSEAEGCNLESSGIFTSTSPTLAQQSLKISTNRLKKLENFEENDDQLTRISSLDVAMIQRAEPILSLSHEQLPVDFQILPEAEECNVESCDIQFTCTFADKDPLTFTCPTLVRQSLLVVNKMLTIALHSDEYMSATTIRSLQNLAGQETPLDATCQLTSAQNPGNGSSVSVIRCSPSTSEYVSSHSITQRSKVKLKKDKVTKNGLTKILTDSPKRNETETQGRKTKEKIKPAEIRKQNKKGTLSNQKATITRRGKRQGTNYNTDSEDENQPANFSKEEKSEEDGAEIELIKDSIHEGDWVVVNFISEKYVLHRFVGQIVKEFSASYEVKFAKKIDDKKFKWPVKTDICEIGRNQVFRKLTPPCFKSTSKRIGAFEFIRSLKQLKIDK